MSFASPIPQCGSQSPPPSQQECYVQNNGQPVVVVANNPVEPSSDSNPLNCGSSQNGQSAQGSLPQSQGQSSGQFDLSSVLGSSQSGAAGNFAPTSSASSPGSSALGGPNQSSSDMQLGQNLADQAAVENPLETLPQSDVPCKVETNTEVENVGGETFVHHPGPIYINQPPTRLIINHPPFVIRPSPIVLNQAGRKVTKEYTKTYLPSPVQVRPIIVRVVKPIEQKVFLDKPASQQSNQQSSGAPISSQPGSGQLGGQSGGQLGGQSGGQLGGQSGGQSSQSSQSGQWGQQSGQSSAAAPCSPTSSQGSNANSLYGSEPIEVQPDVSSDNGSSYQQGSSAGCGCAKK